MKAEGKREVDQERERSVMGGSWVTRLVMGNEIKMTRSVKRQQALSSDKIKMTRVRSRERQRWALGGSRLQATAGFRS